MKSKLLASTVLLVVLLSALSAAVAAAPSAFDSPAFKSLGEFLGREVDWPPFGPQRGETSVEIGNMLLVYGLLLAILYILMFYIPFIKNSPHKNAAFWIAFSAAAIAVTNSTFVADTVSTFEFGTSLTSVGLIILVILAAIIAFKWMGGKVTGGIPGVKQFGEAAYEKAEEAGEKAGEKIKSIGSKEERELATEAQLFQALDNVEGGGIRELEHLSSYLNDLINLLGSGQSFKDVIKGVRDRLGRLNTSFNALVETDKKAENLDKEILKLIKDEAKRMGDEMKVAHSRAIGTALNTSQLADVKKYVDDEAKRLKNDWKSFHDNVNATQTELNDFRDRIRTELAAGLAALGRPNPRDAITTARTHFRTARGLTGNMIAALHNMQLQAERLRNDTRGIFREQEAVDHLAIAKSRGLLA